MRLIKAAIFDLDGTIIDSNPLDFAAWQKVLAEHQAQLSWEEYLQIVGATSAEIVQQYLNLNDEKKTEEIVHKREEYFRQIAGEKGIHLLPGAEKLLQDIRAIPLKMVLATGSNREKLDFVFSKVHIRQYFDDLITADDVTKGKPDPEVFLQAARKINLPPAECMVFEDAKKGVEAAKAGGMTCIAINTNGHSHYLSAADLVIEKYTDWNVRQWLYSQ